MSVAHLLLEMGDRVHGLLMGSEVATLAYVIYGSDFIGCFCDFWANRIGTKLFLSHVNVTKKFPKSITGSHPNVLLDAIL